MLVKRKRPSRKAGTAIFMAEFNNAAPSLPARAEGGFGPAGRQGKRSVGRFFRRPAGQPSPSPAILHRSAPLRPPRACAMGAYACCPDCSVRQHRPIEILHQGVDDVCGCNTTSTDSGGIRTKSRQASISSSPVSSVGGTTRFSPMTRGDGSRPCAGVACAHGGGRRSPKTDHPMR